MTAREMAEYLVGVINQYEPDPESDVPIGLWDKYRVDLIERALLDTIEEASKKVPTNWCDSMLTGPKSVIGPPPWNCKDIERLLIAVADEIRKMKGE